MKPVERYRRWTQTETTWLIDNIHLTRQQQATYLRRSKKSIETKLRDLNRFQKIAQYKKRVTYHYQKHTSECGGIDPIVIERIISAGTIEQYALKNPVCDCERAYILKYVPDGNRILLDPKPITKQRLLSINV